MVLLLNFMLFSIECFLNHYLKTFGFWVMNFFKKYFLSKIPLNDLIFHQFWLISPKVLKIADLFFLICSYSEILTNAWNQIPLFFTIFSRISCVFLAKFYVFFNFSYIFIDKKYNFHNNELKFETVITFIMLDNVYKNF